MGTAPTLSIVFTPQASHNISKPPDTQQYVIDWQSFMLTLNGLLNTIASAFVPAFPPSSNGVVYVVGGAPHVLSGTGIVYESSSAVSLLTGTGLVYENASVPGLIVGSGTVFVSSGTPSVLSGTGLYYQVASSPTLLPGTGLVYESSSVPAILGGTGVPYLTSGAPSVLTGTGMQYLSSSAPLLLTGTGLVYTTSGLPANLTGSGVLYVLSNAPQLGSFGAVNQVLTSTGPTTVPTFQNIIAALGVSSSATGVLDVVSGATGVIVGTGIVRADTSTVAGDGPLIVTGGGTGYTTLSGSTAGALVAFGSGPDNFQISTSGSSGNVLASHGNSSPPTFETVSTAIGLGSSTGTVQLTSGVFIVSTGNSGQVLTAGGAGVTPTFVNQGLSTFNNVTGSRAVNGTVYQNNSNKPMWVVVWCAVSNGQGIACKSDSNNPPTTFVEFQNNVTATGFNMMASFWVLPLHFYEVTLSGGTFTQWLEYQ